MILRRTLSKVGVISPSVSSGDIDFTSDSENVEEISPSVIITQSHSMDNPSQFSNFNNNLGALLTSISFSCSLLFSYLTYPFSGMPRMCSRSTLWRLFVSLSLLCIVYFIAFQDTVLSVSEENSSISSERVVRGGYGNSTIKGFNSLHQRQLTVVMNTFKRHDMMLEAINYYSRCSCVRYIVIIWSEKEAPSERITAKFSPTDVPRVVINIQDHDSLNNRFRPLPNGIHTDALFSVDDDMRIPCSELDLALEVFKGSSRSIIGFMPRVHLRSSINGLLRYRCWWRVWWEGAYSIILTKAALLHHDYFMSYTRDMPESIRTLVDKRRNCEDIAMQFLIANMTSLPPIYVKGHLQDKGTLNGISTSQNVITAGHMQDRDNCLNELVTIYGKNPLVKSHFIIDSAANGWTNAPSTWFEYLSSDLWKW